MDLGYLLLGAVMFAVVIVATAISDTKAKDKTDEQPRSNGKHPSARIL